VPPLDHLAPCLDHCLRQSSLWSQPTSTALLRQSPFPDEIWNPRQKKFVPYECDVPKPQGWGEDIDEAEAQRMMDGDAASKRDASTPT
jgi:hypothetical protein